MMGETGKGAGIQAVEFALQILEFVAQRQGSVGVSELARAFETTKSRIHRHLQTLVNAGYLLRDDDTERYSVSARLMALGQAVSESFELASAARYVTRELRDALGHAVVISQPEREGMRILHLVPSRSNIEIQVRPGSILEYHSSAQGKITLAFGDPMLFSQVVETGLVMATPYTIVDPARLKVRHRPDAPAALGCRAQRDDDRAQCPGGADLRRARELCRLHRPDGLGPVHRRNADQRAGPAASRGGGQDIRQSRTQIPGDVTLT